VNGRESGSAPGIVSLPVGTHRISVRRHGYTSVTAEQTLQVRPSFVPRADTLDFVVQSVEGG
jgi:hypothetical protein